MSKNLEKFSLGTVKLGDNKYGFSSNNSQNVNVFEFLNQVTNFGINNFDTSPRYINSEKLLGNFILKNNLNPKVSTKIDKLKSNNPDIKTSIRNSITNSLNSLNIEKIHICYLHQNDLNIISDKYIQEELMNLKYFKKSNIQELRFTLKKNWLMQFHVAYMIIFKSL